MPAAQALRNSGAEKLCCSDQYNPFSPGSVAEDVIWRCQLAAQGPSAWPPPRAQTVWSSSAVPALPASRGQPQENLRAHSAGNPLIHPHLPLQTGSCTLSSRVLLKPSSGKAMGETRAPAVQSSQPSARMQLQRQSVGSAKRWVRAVHCAGLGAAAVAALGKFCLASD